MRRAVLMASLLGACAGAADEGYLVVDVTFPADSEFAFAQITFQPSTSLERVEPPPFALTDERRRIALHAEGDALGRPSVALHFFLCESERGPCEVHKTVDLANALRKHETRVFCFDFAALAEDQRVDANAALPLGISEDCAPAR